ncbi:MBL fold metallo-hydrolase [Leisingera aquaemixtae]|uniref:MBL fold metallo-hydrolase n=1 Tax=Leisingera aquaemixtae TaxID=1396826 RepID=UPI0021A5AD9C|nr:MBL fold metallo-hydrolase [Leisingera aquaemixtae]UWQ38651.1 MBL fold metallo-hydrolase [Leisingera aquaemixtae]UWQ47056.1 MBL fold metallo-hydrolase [Leisingera aquaemixtae]
MATDYTQGDRIVRHSPAGSSNSPEVWGLYEPESGSVQYICADPSTRKAALIDVVWDFDPKNAGTAQDSIDHVMRVVEQEGLTPAWILDTHPHADHFMASARLKERTGAPTAIGEKVREIAELWRGYYHMPEAFDPSRDFDRLLADGDTIELGDLQVRVMLSPGHTLGSVSYVCGDAAFVHDTLMHADAGTARADFPGGSAEELWQSIQQILSLPENTRLFVGHDYGTDDRDAPAWEATVAEHLARNPHVKTGTRKEDWIKQRTERDKTLSLPDRMLAALQVNLRGGRLGEAESDGNHYLKIPVNKF